MWLKQKPILALAPMADITDQPFTYLCRKYSGKDFVIFREMVSAEAIVRNNEKTLKMCEFDEFERPIVLQVFGAKPITIKQAIKIIVNRYQPDGIDINMGCPMPKITKNKAGSYLLKDQDLAIKIIQAINELNLKIPLSVKTRLGWSSKIDLDKLLPRLLETKIDLLTIHARTKNQYYTGQADWLAIANLIKKFKPSIPIIANGDVKTKQDIEQCLKLSLADGVMIGRGAIGNPFVFSFKKPDLETIKQVVLEHAYLHLKFYQTNKLTSFRKHLVQYFKGLPNIKKFREKLVQVETKEDLKALLKLL